MRGAKTHGATLDAANTSAQCRDREKDDKTSMSINTDTALRALIDAVEQRASTVDVSITYVEDGSTASGQWDVGDGHMRGALCGFDGSRFDGTVDGRAGFEGTLTMNGAGCCWLFCSRAAMAWCDSAVTGGPLPVGPPSGSYGRVASMRGRWDRFGAGGGSVVFGDGTVRRATWSRWLSLEPPPADD
nr:hypothetical protein [Pandoravirus belohorizontensis]